MCQTSSVPGWGGRLAEQADVGEDDGAAGQFGVGKVEADVRTDAGRFAAGDGDNGKGHDGSLMG